MVLVLTFVTLQAKTFEADWMLSIIVRNVVATYAIAGFWDWFLYISPLQVCFTVTPSVCLCIGTHLIGPILGQAPQVQNESSVPFHQPGVCTATDVSATAFNKLVGCVRCFMTPSIQQSLLFLLPSSKLECAICGQPEKSSSRRI